MKTYRSIILLLIAAIAASCGGKKNDVHPFRKDIVQAVYASGRLFPEHHYTVLSKFPGYIQQIHVKAGDVVKSGQLLLTVKNEVGKLNTSSAKNQFDLAKENADENGTLLLALKQEVNAAYSKFRMDSLTFARTTELQKQNAVSAQNFDQAKTQFEISASAYKRATENFNNTRSRVQVELKNAENLYRAQESTENDYSILSVLDGKVYDVIPQNGDLVSSQSPLMEIGDSSRFEVELSVDETDISFLTPGQEIAYTIDAFPGKTFRGKITELYPRVNQASKTSRVKGNIEGIEGLELYSGMSVEANIIFKEKKNALIIPKEFLVNGNQVYVRSQDKPVTVQTGVEDLENIEILSGLNESDVLIKK